MTAPHLYAVECIDAAAAAVIVYLVAAPTPSDAARLAEELHPGTDLSALLIRRIPLDVASRVIWAGGDAYHP